MIQFLRLFVAKAGNGLFPFVTDINSPSDLRVMINQFFHPPRRDRRGNNSNDDDVTAKVEDEVDIEVEDDVAREVDVAMGSLPVSVIANHFAEIQQLDKDGNKSYDEATLVGDENTTDVVEVENFFDSGANNAFVYF